MSTTSNQLDFLSVMNEKVAEVDDIMFPNPRHSENIFIVGAPRSGTTLVSQVLAFAFDLGYINNISATYWNAPAFGVLYGNKLVKRREFSGKSDYGRTAHLSEPHEFGAFWRNKLKYRDLKQKKNHSID